MNEPLQVGEVVQLVRGTGRWHANAARRIGEDVLITGPLARRTLDDSYLRYRVMCTDGQILNVMPCALERHPVSWLTIWKVTCWSPRRIA